MSRSSLFLLLFFLVSCYDDQAPGKDNSPRQTVALIFLGENNASFAGAVKSKLEIAANVNVLILDSKPLPSSAYNPLRKRYKADRLLGFLSTQKPSRANKILGLTSDDIETRSGKIESWGVMGLGYCPGNSCVVSSFRAGKTAKTKSQFIDRMIILCLHELGHTYGVEHCADTTCIMQDAKGKMRLDNSTDYCQRCNRRLAASGLVSNKE